ncbi:MAG TPA: PEP-CTERM sorting domain-containing protein [Phycisphaerae bacterium]|nr:PEP-CTERM sorting domain-containing protein [Phycisphaerae bacterium]HRY67280.1 PEP-CTERM sorting domain-containing protein [Phycisphaerae bacterium]HSA26350.1 PEP-CTERM sorting domain-containing protein [Phycisphaerae bacterium]
MCVRTAKWMTVVTLALSLAAPVAFGQMISNVVETGGDNEATDTITAKWTGQTFAITVANEPFPGAVVGENFTVPAFGSLAPTFVDRPHRYSDDLANSLPVPAYLVGGEYIMSGNDNRDNVPYNLAVTVGQPVTVYMLIDNRLSDGDNATPPTFDATHMQWIVDEGWLATANGLNRFKNTAVPDEVAIDEASDGTINQWYSVYYKEFAAGTLNLLQADNGGRNMYGAVITPEPSSVGLLAIVAVLGLVRRRTR